ncbi:MAG TPA: hypothetical protein DF613_17580 [Lachnospiraceae bacterium]|nr:hypothetical protein [Lachnospiraceae bacterium]
MVWILVLAGLLVYVALLFFSGPLLLLAGYLAALFVLAAVFLIYRRFCVECGVEVPIAFTDEGKEVNIEIHISNKSPLVCGRIRLCLAVSNAFYGKKRRIWLGASDIMPGRNQLLYTLQLPGAGCYDIRVKGMRIYDLTGLAWISKRVNRSASVRVLPDIQPVGVRLTEPVRSFFGDAEVYDEDRAGQDTDEVFQIRSFRPGDKLQSIHWKLSAKTDDLMVREYSLPKACPVVLFLDYQKEKTGQNGRRYLRLAAGLSFSLMDAGCPHYAAWYDGRTQDITRARVDDEESYYCFISSYLTGQGAAGGISLEELYREKYRGEFYLHGLRLTGKAELYKDGERILPVAEKTAGQEGEEVEIVV